MANILPFETNDTPHPDRDANAGLHALQLKTLTPAEDAANPGRRRREA